MKNLVQLFSISILCFYLINCTVNNKQNADAIETKKTDTATEIIKAKDVYIDIVNEKNSTLKLLKPIGLSIKISHERPLVNENNFLSVAGAYTSKSLTIDGLFIEQGKLINEKMNTALTGFCILDGVSCKIFSDKELTNAIKEETIVKGGSLFQQSLLIKNGAIVECTLFGNSLNLRRGLVVLNDNSFFVVEGVKPMTILDFQKELIKIGIKDAVNLDMGSWSEGWYKNRAGEKITSGENMFNTHKQTNWIVYTR